MDNCPGASVSTGSGESNRQSRTSASNSDRQMLPHPLGESTNPCATPPAIWSCSDCGGTHSMGTNPCAEPPATWFCSTCDRTHSIDHEFLPVEFDSDKALTLKRLADGVDSWPSNDPRLAYLRELPITVVITSLPRPALPPKYIAHALRFAEIKLEHANGSGPALPRKHDWFLAAILQDRKISPDEFFAKRITSEYYYIRRHKIVRDPSFPNRLRFVIRVIAAYDAWPLPPKTWPRGLRYLHLCQHIGYNRHKEHEYVGPVELIHSLRDVWAMFYIDQGRLQETREPRPPGFVQAYRRVDLSCQPCRLDYRFTLTKDGVTLEIHSTDKRSEERHDYTPGSSRSLYNNENALVAYRPPRSTVGSRTGSAPLETPQGQRSEKRISSSGGKTGGKQIGVPAMRSPMQRMREGVRRLLGTMRTSPSPESSHDDDDDNDGEREPQLKRHSRGAVGGGGKEEKETAEESSTKNGDDGSRRVTRPSKRPEEEDDEQGKENPPPPYHT